MNYLKNFDCEKCGGLVVSDSPEKKWSIINKNYLCKDDLVCTNCGVYYRLFCQTELKENDPNKYSIEIIN